MEGDEGEELKPTLLMLMFLGGLIGFQVLVCSNAPKLLSEDKLNIHQKCAILEIVSGSLKLSVLHALDSGSLEENDGILSQWEFLSSWSLPGVCLHNK